MVEGKNSSVWTAKEDAELARLQEIHGNRWALVAAELPGKTGQQCAQRWRHKVNPNIKKEKWTAQEDELLSRLYEEHGQRWAEIARHLEGRTDQQCMGRWRRHLDPTVKKDAWNDTEDHELMRLHDKLGPRWSNISKMLTGRTAQQCRARWFQLSAAEASAGDDDRSVASAPDSPKKGVGGAGAKRGARGSTPPISPSTPANTDEFDNGGTVSSKRGHGESAKSAKGAAKGGGGIGVSPGGSPNKKRKTLKDAIAQRRADREGSDGGGGSSRSSGTLADGLGGARPLTHPEGFGNGGGLDMLAMLYAAAVTYERGFGGGEGQGAQGGAVAVPSEVNA
mmetsp:Transcript_5902/g.21530  ORF Transcript_5902/g.21530 Transcript_5902/m.21530 type:complete len:337 (-) Transcript_5902:92-1102(-)